MAYDADRLTGMPDMIIRSKDGSHAHLPPFGGLQCPREEAVEISGIFAAKKAPPTRQLRDQTVRRDLLTRGQHSAAQPSRHMVPYPSHVVLQDSSGRNLPRGASKLDRGCVLSSAEAAHLNAGLLDDSSADRMLRRTNPVLFQSGCHARAPPRCRTRRHPSQRRPSEDGSESDLNAHVCCDNTTPRTTSIIIRRGVGCHGLRARQRERARSPNFNCIIVPSAKAGRDGKSSLVYP